jgi:protein involved in polysaccharide export with SLBB domain
VSDDTSNIQVLGAIEEPGFYDIKKYNNLESLIANLKFVDVYPWLGVLEQFDDNKILKSIVLFSLNDPSTYKSIELLPNSKVYFANIDKKAFDVSDMAKSNIEEYELILNHRQGTFKLPVYGEYSVKSFIDLLGLDMSDVDDIATYISPLEDIVINDAYKNMQYSAQKYNTVSFKSPENNLITVSIIGAIDYPGTYILNNNATVEDLYQLIGNFKSQAYLKGIALTRETIRERQLSAIQKSKEDLNKALLVSTQKGDAIGDIDIIRALSESIDPQNLGRLAGDFSPKSQASLNTVLLNNDRIIVPKNPNAISVFGEVLNPIAMEYKKNLSLNSAINNAGGYRQYADKRRVYVIKANGIVNKASRNIFARDVKLEPGDTIVIPRKIITQTPGIQALIPITQILSDLAFSAAALDNLQSN